MNVIIYGTGEIAQKNIDFFLRNKDSIKIKCFTETHPTKTKFCDYDVKPAAELVLDDVDYIITAMAAGGEAVEYLRTIYDNIDELYVNDRIIRVEMFRHFFEENKLHNMFEKELGINVDEHRDKKIIVSLTSYSKRLPRTYWAIESIFQQNIKADKVILYLDEGEQIPERLLNMQSRGLEIQTRSEDVKVHTKYYYAMKENPDDIVITVDDDIYYDKDLISSLLESYKHYPYAVSARRMHKMKMDKKGNLASYNMWEQECKNVTKPSMGLFAIGVGGVLYPPHCMSKELFNKELFKDICLQNDDIWLKFMQILNNTPVVYANGKYSQVMPVITDNTYALSNKNIGLNQNDLLIKLVEKHFGISLANYVDMEPTSTKDY